MNTEKTHSTKDLTRVTIQTAQKLYTLNGNPDFTISINNLYDNAREIFAANNIILQPSTLYTINAADQTRVFYSDGFSSHHDLTMCNVFYCDGCKDEKYYMSDFTTGYARLSDTEKICFDCAGKLDLDALINSKPGYIKTVGLYYNSRENRVSNWPGTLSLTTFNNTTSKHNIAGTRYDFDFRIDNVHYHGFICGQNQLATVRKLKG